MVKCENYLHQFGGHKFAAGVKIEKSKLNLFCEHFEKTVKEIANNSLHSIVATTILVVLGLVAAYVATFFVDTNILTLILSFSPGGIYEVAVIAIFFDLDPEFVSFHHIIRLLMILFIVPVILRLMQKKT